MKRFLLYLFLFISTICVNAQNLPQRPVPPRLVNDFAHVLSSEQNQILESRLVALDDSTSNQIAIVTIPSLDGYDIDVYANKLYRSWGIGTKKNNNGILILVAVNDHKMRIEVGYGLEGAIPDITAKNIIETDLAPNFRAGNYYRGFDEAITSLGQAAAGEYKEQRVRKGDEDGGGGSILTFFIILIIVFLILGGRGGGGGGRGGGMMSRRGSGWLTPFILGNLMGGGFRGGRGGFEGGGGFGGGGGGFGGFGGGSSGGGGASGGW